MRVDRLVNRSGFVLHSTWNLRPFTVEVYTVEVFNRSLLFCSNDPRLEGLLQNAVRRSLQDMGRRCVQELEKQVRPGS